MFQQVEENVFQRGFVHIFTRDPRTFRLWRRSLETAMGNTYGTRHISETRLSDIIGDRAQNRNDVRDMT